jgi:hypothetical protein
VAFLIHQWNQKKFALSHTKVTFSPKRPYLKILEDFSKFRVVFAVKNVTKLHSLFKTRLFLGKMLLLCGSMQIFSVSIDVLKTPPKITVTLFLS